MEQKVEHSYEVCPYCGTKVPPYEVWCRVCRGNVKNPELGKLASPLQRLGANVIDTLLFSAVAVFVLGAFFSQSGFFILLSLVATAFVYYLEFKEYGIGRTLGKRVFHLRVVKEDGARADFWNMFLREWIVKPLFSEIVFGLGILWILIDRYYQGWHDKLLSTFVVQEEERVKPRDQGREH